MVTDADFIEYLHEQAGLGSRLAHRRMFGEYALYLDDKVVAFACDNSLLLKPTGAGRVLLPRLTLGRPYPEAKDYYVLDEFLDDPDLLRRALVATAQALPAAKPAAARAKPAAKGGAGTSPPRGKAVGRDSGGPAAAAPGPAKTARTAKTAKTAKTARSAGTARTAGTGKTAGTVGDEGATGRPRKGPQRGRPRATQGQER